MITFVEKGSRLEIVFFDEIDSTQKRLVEDLKKGVIAAPIAYFTDYQTGGIGSRGNRWIGQKGNFFLSFALEKTALPEDLPLASASIYFSFLLKELLKELGSKVWLKWPNDFYLEKKVGGCITQLSGEWLVCGIGFNVAWAPEGFDKLDVAVKSEELLRNYLARVEEKISWKQIFSKYKIEFHKNEKFFVHINDRVVSLKEAELMEDGSIRVGGERIYSLR